MLRIFAMALTALAVTGPPAEADHYMQTADPQVVQAIQEIINALGQGCNAGNMQACQAIPMAQSQAQMMLSAGYDCQTTRNPQACGFYQQNIAQLQQTYQQVAWAYQSGLLMQPTGGGGAGAGMGLSHEQRMQQIHDMGVQNTQNWQMRQQQMDTNHQQFIDMIRQ